MSASSRLLPAAPPVPAASEQAVEPESDETRNGFTYRGICITCGSKIVITEEKMNISYFAFCDAKCKAEFDEEMNREVD